MRFFVALAIILGLGFYGWHALSNKKSLLGDAVKNHADAQPVKLSDSAEIAAKRSAEIKPVPSIVPTVAGVAPGSVASGSGPAMAPMEATGTAFYQFKHREPPPVDQMQGLQSMGVMVAMDRQSRSCVVRGPQSAVEAIVSFLASSDTMADSCAVQTWAVYVDRSAEKGFDLVAALRAASGVSGSALDVSGGGFTLDIGAGDVAAALSAICEGSAVEVVHRPHVRLAHGVTSRIESTQELPLPMSVVSNGVSQGSIEFRKVGLQLEVTPFFLSNSMVRMAVSQTNGILGDAVEVQGTEIPVIQSQTVQTTADLSVGQTVVLGGVQTKRIRKVNGLLRDSTQVTEGALYVILSTYSDIPKAVPVGSPRLEYPEGMPVPLAMPGRSSEEWIDDKLQILPPLGWEREEAELVRRKSAK
jgi:type II secretory pathway component GspD/PulD (secretin)